MENKLVAFSEFEDLIFSLSDKSLLKVSEKLMKRNGKVFWASISDLDEFDSIAPLPQEMGKREDYYPKAIDVEVTVHRPAENDAFGFKEVGWYNITSHTIHLLLFPLEVESNFISSFEYTQGYMDRLQKPAVLFDFSFGTVLATNYDMIAILRHPLSVLGQGFQMQELFLDKSAFENLLRWKETDSISLVAELKLLLKHAEGCWFEANFSKVKMDDEHYVLAVFRDINDLVIFQQRQMTRNLIISRLSKVQNSFLSKTSDFNPYQLFLDAILDISGASYGFVGEVGESHEGNRLMKIHAVTDFSQESEDARRLLDKLKDDDFFFTHFDNLFGACIKTGKVISENSPATNPYSSNRKIKGHPQIHNFLGIPILKGEDVVGLIGLGNKPKGFCESDVEDLQPFATTYSVILNALEKEERNHVLQKESSDKALILSTVGDHSPDTIVVLDYKMEINFLSPGYKKHFSLMISDEDAERKIRSIVRKTLGDKYRHSDGYFRSRLRIITLDHEVCWLETSLNIFGEEEERKIIAFIRDVTTQVQSELSLKASLKKERQFKLFLSEFMSILAHEFKTPLATILSSLELSRYYLENMGEENLKMVQKHLGKIESEAENLHKIVVNSLTYERFVKANATLKKEELKLNSFIDETLRQYGLMDQVEWKSEVPSDYRVSWDRFLMQTTIVNLVNNAVKFSNGKPKPQILIKLIDTGFSVGVRDYGVGIAKKDLPYIFTPFYRGANASKVEGTGMGLIAVKNFVKLHGGKVEVKSKLNEGTLVLLKFGASR